MWSQFFIVSHEHLCEIGFGRQPQWFARHLSFKEIRLSSILIFLRKIILVQCSVQIRSVFVVIYSLEMFVKNCTLTILIPWWPPYQPTDSIHWMSIFFSFISFYVSKFKSKFSSISLAFMYNTYVT